MEMRPDFAATGFRKKPPTYTKAEAKTIEEEAKRRREENDARKRALRDEKAKLEKSKHP
ncbi:uncharacterized protein BDR25DRAFT_301079 [Lindgomyces ingoldianus]|uniref:Uncharacterized protein n=1 Tax=Lindgomyces ingoldianus TaxID=673940 RepID=A0ACB6R9E3_9PLEO|nr:uncharacterized protein BDR25DRAFT_301079 [Lindgomyces ingoldianus]KAF2475388.1 hypothetical protein BDR25DRAFT_301079 [Lindgomyces ingoldianus]